MKKLLVFFMVLFGISLGAMAAEEGELIDSKGGNGPCVLVPDDFNSDEPYAVYFKTAESKPTTECVSYFDKVKQELTELADGGNIAYFVVVASADTQGDSKGYPNDVLSGNRFNYAVNNIIPQNSDIRDEGWLAGSVTGRMFEKDKIKNPKYRSVYIYPVWERPTCDQELIDSINDNIAKVKKAKEEHPDQAAEIDKILENYNKALALCDVAGKKLGALDSEALAKYLNGAFSLASKLKINIGITQVTINSDIDALYYSLNRMRDGLKLSVWRDENGNFNTARLVSDSVAGVVLGTVGGIVTSKLVKKNQLKKGFEDLYCAIGGQTVAEYGDDFTVGMR